MPDYTLTAPFEPRYDEADADGLMDELLDRCEDLGPVVDIDATGAAMQAARVAANELVDLRLSRADAREPELQPA